ncbi:hypothetical protein [Microbacterium sp. 10M-3C3]|uniref:hypothetical protein n=1 Tax=Microbacterium sp. 10M-3C3 TaxID=2483401 RepID=UPI000F636D51|nr:hypothetical protein [Microbacterium sp. 10M-3C3]
MRLRPTAAPAAALLALALAACTAQAPAAAPTSVAATPSPSATPTPMPTPTAAEEPLVVVGLDGISIGTQSASYDDVPGLIAVVADTLGSAPTESVIEDPWGNGMQMGRRYDFGAVRVIELGGTGSIAVTGVPDGVRFETAEGITIGSSRSDVEAAGGWEEYAGDDLNAPTWAIQPREVPDTSSLTHRGEVGREFILLLLDGDAVSQIQAPGNDFSDI